MIEDCFDCGRRSKKLKPAIVLADGIIKGICPRCWNNWLPYMHKWNCKCEHCERCLEMLRNIKSD